MGREINRVPMDFDWPIGQTWLAYDVYVKFPDCPDCRTDVRTCGACFNRWASSDGYSQTARDILAGLSDRTIAWPAEVSQWDSYRALHVLATKRGISDTELLCSRCHGEATLATPELRLWAESQPETPLPTGDGWQLWETVRDSPMSPVFATDAELVDWMTTNPWMMGERIGLVPADRQTAERFVAARWAPSMITYSNGSNIEVVDGVTAVTR